MFVCRLHARDHVLPEAEVAGLMPRSQPNSIKPETKSSIGRKHNAGVDEAKNELKEVV